MSVQGPQNPLGIRAQNAITSAAATMANPSSPIQHLPPEQAARAPEIPRAEVTAFATRFRQDHGFELQFTDAAVTALTQTSLATGSTIRALCEEAFRDFHHGLQLVSRNTGRNQFSITREAVQAPDKVLSAWVVESYRIARASEGLA